MPMRALILLLVCITSVYGRLTIRPLSENCVGVTTSGTCNAVNQQIQNDFILWSGAQIQLRGQVQHTGYPEQFGTFRETDIDPRICTPGVNIKASSVIQTYRNACIQDNSLMSGLIMSTGRVSDIRDINTASPLTMKNMEGHAFSNQGRKPQGVSASIFDQASFEFQFTVGVPGPFKFHYIFASVEMPMYGGQEFNDQFHIKISGGNFGSQGRNIAVVSPYGGTNTAGVQNVADVAINQLTPHNGIDPSLFYKSGGVTTVQFQQASSGTTISSTRNGNWNRYYISNAQGIVKGGSAENPVWSGTLPASQQRDQFHVPTFLPISNSPWYFTGYTMLLDAQEQLEAGPTYTLNVSIEDYQDAYLDSALLIVRSKLEVTPAPSLPAQFSCAVLQVGSCPACGDGQRTTTQRCMKFFNGFSTPVTDPTELRSCNCPDIVETCNIPACSTPPPCTASGSTTCAYPAGKNCEGKYAGQCILNCPGGSSTVVPKERWLNYPQCSTLTLIDGKDCGDICRSKCTCTVGKWSSCPARSAPSACQAGKSRQVLCSDNFGFVPPQSWQVRQCDYQQFLNLSMTEPCYPTGCVTMCPCVDYRVVCEDGGSSCKTCRETEQDTCGVTTRNCQCRKFISGQSAQGIPVECGCFCKNATAGGDSCGVKRLDCPACPRCQKYKCSMEDKTECPKNQECFKFGDTAVRQVSFTKQSVCRSCVDDKEASPSLCPNVLDQCVKPGLRPSTGIRSSGGCPREPVNCPPRATCTQVRCNKREFSPCNPTANCSRGCPGEEGFSRAYAECEQCDLGTNPPTCRIVGAAVCREQNIPCTNETRACPPLPPCPVPACQAATGWSQCSVPFGSTLTEKNGLTPCSCDGTQGVRTRSVQCVVRLQRCTPTVTASGFQCGEPCFQTGTPIPVPESFCRSAGVPAVSGGVVASAGIRGSATNYCGGTQQACVIPPCQPEYSCSCSTGACTASCNNCNAPGFQPVTCKCLRCPRSCNGLPVTNSSCIEVPPSECAANGQTQCASTQIPCTVQCNDLGYTPWTPCSPACACGTTQGVSTRTAQCTRKLCGGVNAAISTLAGGVATLADCERSGFVVQALRQNCVIPKCAATYTCQCGQFGPCEYANGASCGTGQMTKKCTCQMSVVDNSCQATGRTETVSNFLCPGSCKDERQACGVCCASCYVGPWSNCPTSCAAADPRTCTTSAAITSTRPVSCRRPVFPNCSPTSLASAPSVADNTAGCGSGATIRGSSTGCTDKFPGTQSCPRQPPCTVYKCECADQGCKAPLGNQRACGIGCGTHSYTCRCMQYTATTSVDASGRRQSCGAALNNGQPVAANLCSNVETTVTGQTRTPPAEIYQKCASLTLPCDLAACPITYQCAYSAWSNVCPTCISCGQTDQVQTRAKVCNSFQSTCGGVSQQLGSVALNLCPVSSVGGTGGGLRVQAIDIPCGSFSAPLQRNCNSTACPQYRCDRSEYTPCQTNCGCNPPSTQTATLMWRENCNAGYVPVTNFNCVSATCQAERAKCIPLPARQCPQGSRNCCQYQCSDGGLSACSTSCGAGFRTRSKICRSICQVCNGGISASVTTTLSGTSQCQNCNPTQTPCSTCPSTGQVCTPTPVTAPTPLTPVAPRPPPAPAGCPAFSSQQATASNMLLALGFSSTAATSGWTATFNPLASNEAAGTFCGSSCGVGTGAVLSTGRISSMPDRNAAKSTNNDFPPTGASGDASQIDLSFNYNGATAGRLTFRYQFLTREMPEITSNDINQGYGDSLRITVNGNNVANLPNGQALSARSLFGSSYYTNNVVGGNCPAGMTGRSQVLTATATISPGQNRISISIQDEKDGEYDSAVLIEAGSLAITGTRRAGAVLLQKSPASAPTAMSASQQDDSEPDAAMVVFTSVCIIVGILALAGSVFMIARKWRSSRAQLKAQMAAEEH